ncbi:MAG: PD-(D/E)XK nuclease family protein [Lactovum sp.]
MKLIYTEINSNLTEILNHELKQLSKQNKSIFYIVPSSLSFEKEREILEQRKILENMEENSELAFFDIKVTRFKQLPYYFHSFSDFSKKELLSPIGQAMLFRQILNECEEGTLSYFDKSRNSSGFIEKLVQLRTELVSSGLTPEDLPKSEKNKDLSYILSEFERKMSEKFLAEDSYMKFITELEEENYQEILKDSIFIVVGFTRFTAQEQHLLHLLDINENLIIASYADEKSIKQVKDSLGVYNSTVKMLENLKISEYIKKETDDIHPVYEQLTDIWKYENDFLSEKEIKKDLKNQESVLIWSSENQLSEIEMLAKEIRQKVSLEKKRYKDFTVLLASEKSYELPIQQIFNLYQIPYFYSKQESMKNHPLIIFLESLYHISKDNYQVVDIINLLKTQLYTSQDLKENDMDFLDDFEYYLKKFKISGKKKFSLVFNEVNYPENPSEFKRAYFLNIKEVEKIRNYLISKESALGTLLSSRRKKKNINQHFLKFLSSAEFAKNFQKLYDSTNDNVIKDKHQQVWKLFQKTLNEFKEIFKDDVMSIEHFLEILVSGIKNADYRQVPSNVDQVKIRGYELIEPRENEYVYVLGLTNSNFPQTKKNQSLLTDDERYEINQSEDKTKFIQEYKVTEHAKFMFTVLSLLNSAKKSLTFSHLQISDNVQETEIPSLLLLLSNHGVPIKKVRSANLDEGLEHIGSLKSTIRSIMSLDFENKEEAKSNFWLKIKNYLIEKDEHFKKLTELDKFNDIKSSGLSENTVKGVYSKLTTSVSDFEEFYNCQYKYFLSHTLSLKEADEVQLESSTIGNYLHRIFELTLRKSKKIEDFDSCLLEAKTKVDAEYQRVFERDYLSLFIKSNLNDILEQSAVMVKHSLLNFNILETENFFKSINGLPIRGRIDRIDEINGRYGAIDYKSGKKEFNLIDIYNKTSLQLLTYLDALSKKGEVWGALYLHLHNPILSLSDFDYLEDIEKVLDYEMSYQGLLNTDITEGFSDFKSINLTKSAKMKSSNSFNSKELSALINYNENLYKDGISTLRSGQIEINPVTKKNDDKLNVTGCQFCQFKSICRFEASRHSGRKISQLDGRAVNMRKDKDIILERILKGELND